MIGSIVTAAGIYEEWAVMGIFLAFIAVPIIITRNVPVSMAVALISLPFLTWLIAHSELATVLSIILILIVGGKFLPTAVSSWKRSKGLKNFIFHDSNPPNSLE